MSGFIHRELTKYERWVAGYEQLVELVADGYDMCVYEYTNDMSCRQHLEDARAEPEVQELWRRVEIADTKLRDILRPTRRCIHGSYPLECFWYWGYPPNSPELESDLRSIDAL